MTALLVQDREGKSTQYPLDGKLEFVVGRATEVDVPLISKNVSRRHAKIIRQGARVFVEDMGSANGVLYNGAKLSGPFELTEGVEVQIGEFSLRLVPSAPPAAPTVSLLGQTGAFLDKVFALKNGDNIIGRGSECDVPVTDNSVSRKHSLVQCGPNGITVKDLGSSNGTFIGDEQVRGVPVSVLGGQRLRFGSMVFLLNAPGMPQAAAPAPLRSVPSQAAPVQAAPVASIPSQAAPVQAAPSFQPPASAPARVVAAPPVGDAVAVPWGRVAVLAIAPLSLLVLLVVAARTLLGGAGGELAALRAELAGATQAVQEATAKKTQGDWTGAEAILSKALTTAPGDPALRALYTEVHFEAQNFALLADAKARLGEKKYAEASEALQQIAPESAASKEADAVRTDASRRLQIGRLLSASESCGARDYKRCAMILCEYLQEEPRDPDARALAALAGREAPGMGCVASEPNTPAVPLLDRYRASVEERYADNPAMKDAALLFFSGEIDKASDALSSASQDPANASQRGALDSALASLAKAKEANRRFREMLDQEKLDEAERAAKTIWEQEEVLFGKEKATGDPIRGSLGHYARNDLVDRFTKQATAGALKTPNEWGKARLELTRAKQLDPRGESFAYYAAVLRLQAAIREACEDASADPAQSRLLGEAALTILAPELAFRAQLAAKLAAPR